MKFCLIFFLSEEKLGGIHGDKWDANNSKWTDIFSQFWAGTNPLKPHCVLVWIFFMIASDSFIPCLLWQICLKWILVFCCHFFSPHCYAFALLGIELWASLKLGGCSSSELQTTQAHSYNGFIFRFVVILSGVRSWSSGPARVSGRTGAWTHCCSGSALLGILGLPLQGAAGREITRAIPGDA